MRSGRAPRRLPLPRSVPWSGARAPPAWVSRRRFRQRPRCLPSDDLQLREVIGHALGASALVFDDLTGRPRLGGFDLDDLLGQGGLACLPIEPHVLEADLLHFFVLRLHDAAQRGIAGLVDAAGHRDDGGQWRFHQVVAIIGLPVDLGLAVADLEFLGKAEQWQPEEFGQLRGHRARRSVRALGSADDQVVGLALDRPGDRPRRAQRIRVLQPRVGDQYAPVGAHRQRPSDCLHRPWWAHRDDGRLAPILLDDLEAGFDRVLVTRIEHDVDALAHQSLALRVELSGDVRIGNLLHADEDIHSWLLPLWETASDRTYVLSWKTHAPQRVFRDRGQVRPQPGPAHGLQLVAESVPGLLSQLRLLFCPRPCQARRPRPGRGLFRPDRGQGQSAGTAPARTDPPVLEAPRRRLWYRDRSLSADRGHVQAHAPLPGSLP